MEPKDPFQSCCQCDLLQRCRLVTTRMVEIYSNSNVRYDPVGIPDRDDIARFNHDPELGRVDSENDLISQLCPAVGTDEYRQLTIRIMSAAPGIDTIGSDQSV